MGNNNAGCLSFFFPFLKSKNKSQINDKEEFPYALRDDFLSSAEYSFYKVMRQALDKEIIICPKVGLKDIFFVNSKDKSTFMTYHNKIDRKHVDFLLCDAETMKPICGVELDDSSHQKESRITRDEFVDKLFKVSKLQLLRFKNKKSYSLSEIKDQLDSVINKKTLDIKKVEIKQDSEILHKNNNLASNDTCIEVPICPKCQINMTKRTVSKGENKGKEFYGCSNFPKCRQTKQI